MPKILLIDDNEINRDLFRLERTGDRSIRQSRRFANVASDGAQGVTKTPAVRVAFALRNRPETKSSVQRYF